MRKQRLLTAAAAALLLVLAGCGGDDGDDDAKAGGKVKTPAGGWPQPENGRITEKMCGLLVEGKTDTGVTQMLHLEASGKGKAGSVQYYAPDRPVVTLRDVKLPWKKDLPLADHGDQLQNLSLDVHAPLTSGIPISVSCRILVDDRIVKENQNIGYAGCLGHVPKN